VFASDAPRRRVVHQPGCRFGDGFYKVVHDDELGHPRARTFATQAEADLLVRLLPPGRNVRGYRDSCLDAPTRVDAGTPDVVDAEWWLGLPIPQAMEELGLTDERVYARVHRMVTDAVYTRDNRERQGGVRAPIVIKRKLRPHNAHLFAGGTHSDATHIPPAEYDPTRGG